MIEAVLHQAFLQTTYIRPPFFSINYWAWPLLYMGTFMGLFIVPAMSLNCNFDDIVIAAFLGLNFGVLVGIISSITPFYMLIFTLLAFFVYMVLD